MIERKASFNVVVGPSCLTNTFEKLNVAFSALSQLSMTVEEWSMTGGCSSGCDPSQKGYTEDMSKLCIHHEVRSVDLLRYGKERR